MSESEDSVLNESLSDSERSRNSSNESHQGYPGHAGFGSSRFQWCKLFSLFPWRSNNSVDFVARKLAWDSQVKRPRIDPLIKGLGDDGYYQSSDEERTSDTTYSSSNGSRFGNNPTGSLDDLYDLIGVQFEPFSPQNYLVFYPQNHQPTYLQEQQAVGIVSAVGV